ncbi:hypothetical protein C0989_011077 [Termitomyces sp. Mn162]|nr:hypothetical protein C0989_011077 [Termitomyces sp. Mn162]
MLALFAVLVLLTGVNAHFRLLYPEPRGVFIEDQEPNFCGGDSLPHTHRTLFIMLDSSSTAGVLLSTAQDPVSFDNFSVNGVQQIVGPYAKEANAGTFCIPLNISAAGIDNVRDGSNVTIQVVFAGGDGNLYQCADLTLASNFTIPSNVTCQNETAITATSTGTSSPSQTGGAVKAAQVMAASIVLTLGCIVVVEFL